MPTAPKGHVQPRSQPEGSLAPDANHTRRSRRHPWWRRPVSTLHPSPHSLSVLRSPSSSPHPPHHKRRGTPAGVCPGCWSSYPAAWMIWNCSGGRGRPPPPDHAGHWSAVPEPPAAEAFPFNKAARGKQPGCPSPPSGGTVRTHQEVLPAWCQPPSEQLLLTGKMPRALIVDPANHRPTARVPGQDR